jgi:hypothetical protein
MQVEQFLRYGRKGKDISDLSVPKRPDVELGKCPMNPTICSADGNCVDLKTQLRKLMKISSYTLGESSWLNRKGSQMIWNARFLIRRY